MLKLKQVPHKARQTTERLSQFRLFVSVVQDIFFSTKGSATPGHEGKRNAAQDA